MDQDWEPVVVRKKVKKPGSSAAANEARRAGGEVESVRKYAAGTNKHTATGPVVDARRLDDETDASSHQTVPLTLALAIQQGRQGKGWTQKQLAAKICEKAVVVQSYEQGKAIPNNAIIRKMEKALGVRLPRPPKKKKVDDA
eukprot:TRINITY_DN555_c0_g1_i1.p2 TRINITY_DN555_c0_g1~~TRINITY_DN555_c0_g1_i1.p2  ORF type:complete len:142 (+),score=56.56 TRINITY_DN555_c0_g1_i1:46-471(+)